MVDLVTIGKLKTSEKSIFHLVLTLSHTLQNAEIHCGLISQQTLCKNQVSFKSVRVRIFCVDLTCME